MTSPSDLQRSLPSNHGLVVKMISQPGRGLYPTLATKVRDIDDEDVKTQVYIKYMEMADTLNRYRVDMGNGYIFMCDSTGDSNFAIDDAAYDAAFNNT